MKTNSPCILLSEELGHLWSVCRRTVQMTGAVGLRIDERMCVILLEPCRFNKFLLCIGGGASFCAATAVCDRVLK
jgi:hypothetical protein